MKIRWTAGSLMGLTATFALTAISALQVLAAPPNDDKAPHAETIIPYAPTADVTIPYAPSIDEDCGCNPVAFATPATATQDASPTKGVTDDLTAQPSTLGSETEAGSTVPGKKLTLIVSGVCQNKQHAWGSATANGYGKEGPPTVTIKAAGKSRSGTGSASLTVNSNASTVTFTASAPGYTPQTKTATILQTQAKDFTPEIRSRIIQPAVNLIEKIRSIPIVGPGIVGDLKHSVNPKASGRVSDCCEDDKKIENGYKRASVNVTYGFAATPVKLSKTWKRYGTPKGWQGYGLNISAELKYNLPGNISGSGQMNGNYQSLSCGGRTCVGLNGNLAGYLGGTVSAALETAFVVPKIFNRKTKKGVHAGTVTVPFNIRGNYKECPTNSLHGRVWLQKVQITVPPLQATLPEELQSLFPGRQTISFTTTSTTLALFKGETIYF